MQDYILLLSQNTINSSRSPFLCAILVIPPLRLMFSRSQHHVTAEVFSCTSPVPVLKCSTKEWAVKRELASTQSVAACQAVGEVLALRCQQAGITRMVYCAIPWTFRSDAVSTCCWDRWVKTDVFCTLVMFAFYLAGSGFQKCHERGRSHSQWTQEEIYRFLTLPTINPCLSLNSVQMFRS